MKSKLYYLYLALVLLVTFFLTSKQAVAQQTDLQRTTIMQYVITERPVLAELLTTAGMAPALSGNTTYTLLMPPESSLEALRGESAEKLKSIMARHILKGELKGIDFKDGNRLQTYGSETLYICRKKSDTLVNGMKLQPKDTSLRNGVVQEIASTLQP